MAPRISSPSPNAFWLYGLHAVIAALQNPERQCHKLLATKEAAKSLADANALSTPKLQPKIVSTSDIHKELPEGAVHQGIALSVDPLPPLSIEDVCDSSSAAGPFLILDEVTDPHNVGAILRSCAGFGAKGLIITEKNSPSETGTLAKSASGALEHTPLIRAVNLSQALSALKEKGYWTVGLDERAEQDLGQIDLDGPMAFVMGSEGKGLRRLTRENCDFLAKLPTEPSFPTLNVSNAAAICLYAHKIASS